MRGSGAEAGSEVADRSRPGSGTRSTASLKYRRPGGAGSIELWHTGSGH